MMGYDHKELLFLTPYSMLQFNEIDNELDLHFSLNEIKDQLHAWLGPEQDQEFYDISMHCTTVSLFMPTC